MSLSAKLIFSAAFCGIFFYQFLTTSAAFAQLSVDDIDELRERGCREGWTFSVGETPATRRPLPKSQALIMPEFHSPRVVFTARTAVSELPEAFDWRALDGCTPVKDQGTCGSCWAFGTVGAFESAIKIHDTQTVDLSEQYLVSCNTDDYDCIRGGWFSFDYFQWKPDHCGGVGAVLELYFPYTAADFFCDCPFPHRYLLESWGYVGGSGLDTFYIPDVEAIKQAIYDYGPVAVGVYVNRPFAAYTGGVFNACENKIPNHIVVLVGWDDTLGEEGVWILKNSWNIDWGEDGYMYIEYGCCEVGLSACFVNYTGYSFFADTTVGWPPLEVNFTGWDNYRCESWWWAFGDGDSAFTKTPGHVYTTAGRYDVSFRAANPIDTHTITRENHIIVLADSLIVGDYAGEIDSLIEVPVAAVNNIPLYSLIVPVEYAGPLDLEYVGYTTAGCRTDSTAKIEYRNIDANQKRFALDINYYGRTHRLEPGSGPIIILIFKIKSGENEASNPLLLDGYNLLLPHFIGELADYAPVLSEGSVTYIEISCCSGLTGNTDCSENETPDISDITCLIDYLYGTHEPLCCPEEADVDISGGEPDISDITKLIDHLYLSHSSLPECPL
ncbi:MAG: hypothetical protein JXA92_11605 [candidate division Zixibacteria bacterium]|nr:hypothetical protein [candidate division Zixibacteria bacterium]